MIIENITNKGISLDRNGQSMQREVYEKEIVKLQSNWNSLRELIESEIKQEHHTKHWDMLDKMNELESGDK